MSMQQWNVRVVRDGEAAHIGKVGESTEALARCAALSRSGLSEDEVEAGGIRPRGAAIYPDEDSDVSPSL